MMTWWGRNSRIFAFHIPGEMLSSQKKYRSVEILPMMLRALGIQSYSQQMIGVSNHFLRIVLRFHYHSQKGIGSVGLVKLLYFRFKVPHEAFAEKKTAHCVHLVNLFNFNFQQQSLEGLSRSSLLLPSWGLQCFCHKSFQTKKSLRGSSKVNEIFLAPKRLRLREGSDDTILNPKSQSPLQGATAVRCFGST